jgi:hypothetical protein
MYFPPPSPSSSSPATPGRSTASGEDDQKLAIYLEQKQKIEELHQKLERTAEQILVRSAILGDKVSSLSQPAAEVGTTTAEFASSRLTWFFLSCLKRKDI